MMKTLSVSVLTILASLFISSKSPADEIKELKKEFKKYGGFTVLTPFSQDALPGTMFVLVKGGIFGGGGVFKKRVTEFRVSSWDETFKVDVRKFHNTDKSAFGDITKSLSLSGSLEGSLIQPVVNAKLATKYSKKVTMGWGGLVERKYFEMKDVLNLKSLFSADVMKALEHYKRQGQLDDVYLIVESAVAPSVSIKFEAKPGFEAEFKVDKIKQFANVGAKGKVEASSDYKLEVKEPIVVAYKALRLDRDLLDRSVNSLTAEDVAKRIVTVEVLEGLKTEE